MNLNIKKLLKQLNVLFLTEKDESYKRIENILNIFFKQTINTNSIEYAIEHYNNSQPAVIIVDINLRDKNGIDFIKEIRKKNKSIPILIITENKETNNLIEAVKLNLIDYLLKPLDLNNFIFCINLCAKQIINNGKILTIVKKDIKYNYLEKVVINKEKDIELTKNESRLIELFLSKKNKYVSKDEIKKHIWTQKEITESAFKSLISRLSKK